MKQFFCYTYKLRDDGSFDEINKKLDVCCPQLTFTYHQFTIGKGDGTDDRRIGYIQAPTQDDCDNIIENLKEYNAKKITIQEAHDLHELLTNLNVTINNDSLEWTYGDFLYVL